MNAESGARERPVGAQPRRRGPVRSRPRRQPPAKQPRNLNAVFGRLWRRTRLPNCPPERRSLRAGPCRVCHVHAPRRDRTMWRATRRRARAGPARRGPARGLPRGVVAVERRERPATSPHPRSRQPCWRRAVSSAGRAGTGRTRRPPPQLRPKTIAGVYAGNASIDPQALGAGAPPPRPGATREVSERAAAAERARPFALRRLAVGPVKPSNGRTVQEADFDTGVSRTRPER